MKSKIGLVSGPISVSESESQRSERLLFVATPLMTPSRAIKGKLDHRSREQKQRNISVAMLVLIRCDWGTRRVVLPLLLATSTV